jgi:hypothetical protein
MARPEANEAGLSFEDTLWAAADKLRGAVDAAEYKHVVLGLLFLKYVSDAFESRREALKVELAKEHIVGPQLESLLESRDEYIAEHVFWVPPESRWSNIRAQARQANIATLLDDAILAVERDNPNLKSKLPRDYARRGIPADKLGGLIDLVSGVGFKGERSKARDTLGRVYEYFLGKFAAAEGKLGGEFYTTRGVVRLLVEMLEPYNGRVYDPCCGSGGMFVQSERFVQAHGGLKTDISIFGQESNPMTWRLAHMNLAIRGIEANLGQQEVAITTYLNLHPIQRGNRQYPKGEVERWLANFHTKVEFLLIECTKRGVTLLTKQDEVIWFHELRNGQYHGGGAAVPQSRELAGARAAAIEIIALLFDVPDLEKVLDEHIAERMPPLRPARTTEQDRLIDNRFGMVELCGQPMYTSEVLYAVDPERYRETAIELSTAERRYPRGAAE